MELNEVVMLSPHYSTSRGPYNKVVLHTTEGAMKIRDLGSWFQNPSANCSSHHGADNYERGVFGSYVYENYKAWTQGNANPYCLSLEMCAYSSWSRDTWLNQKAVLVDNAAQWVRYMVDKYDIPWKLLNNTQAQDPNVRGICEHVNFGSWGSGHGDCGNAPVDVIFDKARNWGGSAAGTTEEGIMAIACVTYNGSEYYAGISESGKVRFRQPGGSFFDIDSTQSGAKSGCGLTIADNGKITISYTNGKGAACIYQRQSGSADWVWNSLSGDNSFK